MHSETPFGEDEKGFSITVKPAIPTGSQRLLHHNPPSSWSCSQSQDTGLLSPFNSKSKSLARGDKKAAELILGRIERILLLLTTTGEMLQASI